LEHENSDGVTVLLYLQTLYKLDWANFLERLGIRDLKLIWSPKYLMETRLWASLRAQTLSRTVLGMMHYEAALRLQAQLERWGSTNQTTLRKKHAKKKKHTHTHTHGHCITFTTNAHNQAAANDPTSAHHPTRTQRS
jgi:hypothetical protein